MINWKNYVDQIYVITHTKRINNEYFYNELKRVGIYDSNIMFIFENIQTPFYKELFNIIVKNNNADKYVDQGYNSDDIKRNTEYSKVFNSVIAHYYCLKHAQQHEYSKILILEDDLLFLKDLNQIETLLNNAYNFYSEGFIYLGNLSFIINDKYNTTYQCTETFNDEINRFYINTVYGGGAAFNIYDKKAYEYLINFYESYNYAPLDLYSIIYENALEENSIKILYSNTHIAIQYDWLKFFLFATRLYNIEYINNKYEILNGMIGFVNHLYSTELFRNEALNTFNILFEDINKNLFDSTLDKYKLDNLNINI